MADLGGPRNLIGHHLGGSAPTATGKESDPGPARFWHLAGLARLHRAGPRRLRRLPVIALQCGYRQLVPRRFRPVEAVPMLLRYACATGHLGRSMASQSVRAAAGADGTYSQ